MRGTIYGKYTCTHWYSLWASDCIRCFSVTFVWVTSSLRQSSLFLFPLPSGTSSTNTVVGTGQNQNQPPVSQSQSCKGMFTDELHKLVDNWARDAMNLSQGKRGSKHQQQVAPQGHSYDVRLCSWKTQTSQFNLKLHALNKLFFTSPLLRWSLLPTWAVSTRLRASCAQASLQLWVATRPCPTLPLPLWGPGRAPCVPRHSTASPPHLTAPSGLARPRTPRPVCWPPHNPWANMPRCPPLYRPSTSALCKSQWATRVDPTWRPRRAGPSRARPKCLSSWGGGSQRQGGSGLKVDLSKYLNALQRFCH